MNPEESLWLFGIGLSASFLGTLAGGGGLMTIPAMMLFGLPVQTGVATNKFSSGIASVAGMLTLIKQKALTWRQISCYLTVSVIGGMSGAVITSHVSERTMNAAAVILLLFALVVSLKKWDWKDQNPTLFSNKTDMFWTCLIAAYDGGFGPGSSTFGILHYRRITGTYVQAVQFTRVLIAGSCLGAFVIFSQTAYFQWKYAVPMALGSMIGTELALKVLPNIPDKLARHLITAIISLLIVQLFFKLL